MVKSLLKTLQEVKHDMGLQFTVSKLKMPKATVNGTVYLSIFSHTTPREESPVLSLETNQKKTLGNFK